MDTLSAGAIGRGHFLNDVSFNRYQSSERIARGRLNPLSAGDVALFD